jgi:glutamine phosphoribosylpyrophosphate amidotransferase
VSRLVPRMLLDIQNRGQLSAGMTAWSPGRSQLLATLKDVGSVTEVFRLSHRGKYESLMEQHLGRAAIGHVRYATCGAEDRGYAQPLERPHLQKRKWFAFGFNGQLANYSVLKRQLLADGDHHLALDTDTEIILQLHYAGLRIRELPIPTTGCRWWRPPTTGRRTTSPGAGCRWRPLCGVRCCACWCSPRATPAASLPPRTCCWPGAR